MLDLTVVLQLISEEHIINYQIMALSTFQQSSLYLVDSEIGEIQIQLIKLTDKTTHIFHNYGIYL